MSEEESIVNEMEEEAAEDHMGNNDTNLNTEAAGRRERRKAAKKEKRKKKRKEVAEMVRREEEARLNDPEEQLRLQAEEEQEKVRVEKERREFEERERKIMEEWERKRAQEEREEEERRRRAEEEKHHSKQYQDGNENELDDDGWEYVEDGPPEIIWQGNEIIVKKKKVRVKKKDRDEQKEDPNRPTSNPLPPQSEVFADYKDAPNLSAQQLLENVAQETPNFGTEQDKAHCPFHLKTGACRFGSRCSRIHFYPDKACTLLIKNMYNGPGLAWEQDEGLEYSEEEVERAYEEFYEDVHTEFLKFGEIVNFKACRNGSSHLRGNVYVHYKSLDSAVMAYQSVNGRYFAGKQIQCEFVAVTRWKVAICGEYMKSKLQTCSRGMTCNFIHCFRNPGGDYEWADSDKPPPRYWLKKMAALFGYSDESGYDKQIERESPRSFRNSSGMINDADRYHRHRSQSRDTYYAKKSRNYSEDNLRGSTGRSSHHDAMANSREKRHHKNNVSSNSDSDRDSLERQRESSHHSSRNRSRSQRKRKSESRGDRNKENMSDTDRDSNDRHEHRRRRSSRNREKKCEIMDGNQGGGVEMERLDVDRYTYEDNPDEERNSTYAYMDQSPQSDGVEEFEDKKSRRRASKVKYSRWGREDGETDPDCGKPSNGGRSFRSSDSSSRDYSRKDARKLGSGDSEKEDAGNSKKSKRKIDDDKDFDSGSRLQYHEARLSDSGADKRGRWEPEGDNFAEYEGFH